LNPRGYDDERPAYKIFNGIERKAEESNLELENFNNNPSVVKLVLLNPGN
jgi:hypothetical protein